MRLLLMLIALLAGATAAAGETLQNQDVVRMAALKLGDQIVIAKIESVDVAFDTRPEALADLMKAGVSDAVMAAMVRAQSGPRGHEPPAAGSAIAGLGAGEMYLAGAEQASPMVGVKVTSEYSSRKDWIPFGSGASETFFFIDGTSSATRADASPRFFSRLPPDRVRLVSLGLHKRSNDRYVVFSGSRSERVIALQARPVEAGVFELTVAQPLPAGEYALLVSPDLSASTQRESGPMAGMMAAAMANMAFFVNAYDFKVGP
jgi:hypothetical protein